MPGDIRAARVQLALALMESEDRLTEAAHELESALDEAGDDPPDWRIHLHLGRVAERAGDEPVAAISEVLAAVVAAPPEEAEEPARAALAMLAGQSSHQWVSRLADSQVDALVSRARAPDASSLLVSLAATFLFLRGDYETAGSLVSASSSSEVRADPHIGTAQTVARASQLIDSGEFRSALAVLEEAEVPGQDPVAASMRALADYGLGDLDAALDDVADAPETFDTALAEALVWLRRAGEKTETEEGVDPVAQAGRAASAAARLGPSAPDGLLLRAQVELEGTFDISDGRRLLEQAILRLDREPERARHWALQRRVRTDDAFRYMTLEVAAACGRTEELFALQPHDLPFARTDYRQDAAAADLVAGALKEAGRGDEAAAFFESAGRFHTYANEPDLALSARRQATELHPTAERLLELADDQWQASYRMADTDDADAAIAAGLSALDRLENEGFDADTAQRVDGAYKRGLLLARRADLRPSTLLERWLPLPWLLVAGLDDPTHSYRAMHLAWACNDAGLSRPAWHFAERAIGLDENDRWLREGYVVMHFNWFGVLDEKADAFIDDLGYQPWGSGMRETDALNRNDLSRLRKFTDGDTFDALWARLVRAQSITRLDGLGRAQERFAAVKEEAAKDLADPLVAAECSLVLRELDDARRYIELGVEQGKVSPRAARFRTAMIDVVAGGDADLELLYEGVDSAVDPSALRDWAYSVFPIVAEAWADNHQAVQVLEELQRRTAARIDTPTLPSLTVEIDKGFNTSTDPELDRLVRELLHAEEGGGVADAEIAEDLRRLASDSAALAHAGPILDAIATAR